jgi:hypothetical protein
MGNLLPALNENLARSHAADLYAQADLWREQRAVRGTRTRVAGRWRSRFGCALVQAGFALMAGRHRSARLPASSPERLPGPGERRQQLTLVACKGVRNG